MSKTSGIILAFILGLICSFITLNYFRLLPFTNNKNIVKVTSSLGMEKRQVIGFLPYWLLAKADKEYSPYLTTLTYFGLTLGGDGSIQHFTNPGEADPGWHALYSGKVDPFLEKAKKDNLALSLLLFSGDESTIAQLISDPVPHAQKVIDEVTPLMKQYGFTDLNMDIESVKEASESARQNFTSFIAEIKRELDEKNLGTLTVDASPIVLVKPYLTNLTEVSKLSDQIVLMTYDYHYSGSFVTGPVSPMGGVPEVAEFDTLTALKETLKVMPPQKILLGLPLYGYEWETVGALPRSAVIPGTGLIASNRRVEELITTCGTCSAQLDTSAQEKYLVYQDANTGTYHQIFYPDENATQEKLKVVQKYNLGGIAVWALGYEGNTILSPLTSFVRH